MTRLLLPVSAPWLKFAEAAAYAREVATPGGGYAIHDAILSEQGIGLVSNLQHGRPPRPGAVHPAAAGTTVDL